MAVTLATYFNIVVVGIDVLLGILLFRILKSKKTKATRVYFFGIISFFFTHAACRSVFLLDVVIPDRTLFIVGTFLGLLSVVFIVAAIEMTVFTRSHHFFTIYGIAGLIVMAIDIIIYEATLTVVKIGTMQLIILTQTLMQPVLAGIIVLVYLNLAIKSIGRVRSAAIVMVIAVALFGIGEMANSDIASSWIPWAGDVAPIVITAALVLLFYSVSTFFKE